MGTTLGQTGKSTYLTISSGMYPGAPTWTIYIDGSDGLLYAKTQYGEKLASGVAPTNGSWLLNQVFGTLPGGGSVYLKAQITAATTITIPYSNITFYGDLGYSRITLAAGVNDNILEIGTLGSLTTYCTVHGITFDGSYSTNTVGYAIAVYSNFESHITSNIIKHMASGGIYVNGSPAAPSILPWISENLIEFNRGRGIFVENAAYDAMISRNNIGNNTGVGIFASADNAKISENSVWFNNIGIQVYGCHKFYINNNELDSNLQEGIVIQDSDAGTIIGNHLYGASQGTHGAYSGIKLHSDAVVAINTQNVVVDSNNFYTQQHTITDDQGNSFSVGNNSPKYCVEEVNSGAGNTDGNLIQNCNTKYYVTAPILTVGGSTRIMDCYPEIVNRGFYQSVADGAANHTITFPVAEADNVYAVWVTPNWNTTIYITARTTTNCTVAFGSVAPIGGWATIDYKVTR